MTDQDLKLKIFETVVEHVPLKCSDDIIEVCRNIFYWVKEIEEDVVLGIEATKEQIKLEQEYRA